MDFCLEVFFVFVVGGEKEIKVWDIRESVIGIVNLMLIYKYRDLLMVVFVL